MSSTLIFANTFNENNTTTVRDYSENLNDSATAVSLSVTADTVGYYLDLDGANDYYTIDNSTDYAGGDFTIAGMFWGDSAGAGFDTIFSTINAGGKFPFSLVWDHGANELYFYGEDAAAGTITLRPGSDPDEWTKFVVTYDQSTNTVTAYANSEDNSDTDTLVLAPQDDDFWVGATAGGPSDYFLGRVRELRFYNSLADADWINEYMSLDFQYKLSMPEYDDNTGTITPTDTFNVGDLIESVNENPCQLCVTGIDTNNIYVLPFSVNAVMEGVRLSRLGHRWDTARQYTTTLKGDDEAIYIHNGVNTFVGFYAGTFVTTTINKTGVVKKGLTKTANYTLSAYDHTIYCDTSGGGFTITMPSSPVTDQEWLIIKTAATGLVKIDGNGNNLNGSSFKNISSKYDAVQIKYTGTELIVK